MKEPGFFARRILKKYSNMTSADLAAMLGANTSAAGKSVTHESALAVSAVYACVKVLAETVSSLPLHVYKKLSSGGKERAYMNPLYDLLTIRPNPWQTSMEWREQMMEHLLLRGNYYAWINKVNGEIKDLIPLHPDKVTVKQLADYSLSYELARSNGDKLVLSQAEVLHIRAMPGGDGILGRSVIGHQKDLFGSAMATQEYAGKLFSNDATPGVIIKTQKSLTSEAIKRLRESWMQAYGGSSNARGTAILEDGASIEKLAMSSEEAQFIETRRLQRSEVAGLFRVPLMLLQADQNTTTYASAEQFMLSFMIHSIRPWLVRIEQGLHKSLFLAPKLYFPEFNPEGILRGDIATRYNAYAVGRQWGWLSANDIRFRENMNPIEGGDVYLTPLNMVDSKDIDRGDSNE